MKTWLALALVLLSPSTALAAFKMQIHNVVTDLSGNEITSIEVGQQFKLQTIVTDVRNPPPDNPTWRGVFSAGADISFDSTLSSLNIFQSVEFGSFFWFQHERALLPGRIRAYAASAEFNGPGNDPQHLFSVVLTAESPGLQVFTPTQLMWPNRDYTIYTDPEIPLLPESLEFIGTTLTIVPEPSTCTLGAAAMLCLITLKRRKR